jgi:hypothetical protein
LGVHFSCFAIAIAIAKSPVKLIFAHFAADTLGTFLANSRKLMSNPHILFRATLQRER